ncbi:MAG: DUF4351 domain-containing protein [Cyanothece sp. SIO1E1]|nr:DUF4351 domain-containing protein [Cyanothece sp. SIO1E1]
MAAQIEQISKPRVQSNVTAATAILSGLVLEKELIQRILRRELMQESVIYQEIKAEGIQEGIQQGIQERSREARQLVLRLLTRKVGDVPEDNRNQIEQLEPSQLEALMEALLDFEQLDDLENWLAEQAQLGEASATSTPN